MILRTIDLCQVSQSCHIFDCYIIIIIAAAVVDIIIIIYILGNKINDVLILCKF